MSVAKRGDPGIDVDVVTVGGVVELDVDEDVEDVGGADDDVVLPGSVEVGGPGRVDDVVDELLEEVVVDRVDDVVDELLEEVVVDRVDDVVDDAVVVEWDVDVVDDDVVVLEDEGVPSAATRTAASPSAAAARSDSAGAPRQSSFDVRSFERSKARSRFAMQRSAGTAPRRRRLASHRRVALVRRAVAASRRLAHRRLDRDSPDSSVDPTFAMKPSIVESSASGPEPGRQPFR